MAYHSGDKMTFSRPSPAQLETLPQQRLSAYIRTRCPSEWPRAQGPQSSYDSLQLIFPSVQVLHEKKQRFVSLRPQLLQPMSGLL